MESPILAIHREKTFVCRVGYAPMQPATDPMVSFPLSGNTSTMQGTPGGGINISMVPIGIADAVLVQSIEEAEDVILALPTVIEHELNVKAGRVPEVYMGVMIQALRYTNMIAARTRRAPGNVILMGRGIFEKAKSGYEAIGSEGFIACEPETVGRWTKMGSLIGNIPVYVGDALPDDEVFVSHKGPGTAADGPGVILKDGNDLYLYTLPNSVDALGNALDFVQRFRIKEVA